MSRMITWRAGLLSRWHRHLVPGLVWLAAAGSAAWLFADRSRQFAATAVARGELRQIATENPGRLALLPVRLFEQVQAGQTLAVLEDDRVQAELATAAAETARLRAEIAAAENSLLAEIDANLADFAANGRRFALDAEDARVQELELTVTLETDRITLQRRRFNLDRLLGLSHLDTAAADELNQAQTDYAALEKKIEDNALLLTQRQHDRDEARQRRDAFTQLHPPTPDLEKTIEPLRAAVAVQERRLAELALDRATLVLRSPIEGVVSEVLRRPGEAVMAGEPILVVSAPRPSEIVAYVTAAQAAQLQVGTPVQLTLARTRDRRPTARSQVIGLAPSAEQLPARLWQNPTVPEWGWAVGIAVPTDVPILTGEIVFVRGL